jgi:hypothetical protein
MTTTHFPNLAATPPPLPVVPAFKYAHRMRHPGDPITRQRFEFRGLALKVRGFLANQIGVATRDSAARMLWVQGKPGEGKTEGCLVAALNAGFTVLPLSGGDFAGEVEGASVKALHETLEESVTFSKSHRRRVIIALDDFDLSTASIAEDTAHTINSQLLIREVMRLADERHLYRNFDGSNIAFIVTVNDASGMRESLTRVGRAEWHDHIPSDEDKANIAHAILAPQTSPERDLVRKLVRKHRAQPIAFWKALHHRMQTLQANNIIAHGMPTASEIDAVFGHRLALNADIAWQAAKEIRSTRVRSFLTKRSGGR